MSEPRQRRSPEERALLRAHHPDHGGDPDAFVRLLAQLDADRHRPAEPGRRPPSSPAVTIVRGRPSGPLHLLAEGLDALAHSVRRRLPRRAGGRRYVDL